MSSIVDWIENTAEDQDAQGKNSFLQTGKYEKTRLRAVGISNPTLKKAASSLYKQLKDQPFTEVLDSVDDLMQNSEIYEAQLLSVYILEKFKRQFNDETFNRIDSWIDSIDYWAISDHLAINLFGHFPLNTQEYQQRLFSWLDSDHYWRRRQALTAYLAIARKDPDILDPVLRTIRVLLPEDNYYIKKAIPWILREAYRKHPQHNQAVFEFLKQHISSFSKTMLREAMRYLSEKQQQELLKLYG
ncbi:MAG: DNA alkylation repair protein [Candidatus Kariarchaeaceae archaeon]|jgi:3-methyladenine DNA glycosylase AlkD